MSVFLPINENEPATENDKVAFGCSYAILFGGFFIAMILCMCSNSSVKHKQNIKNKPEQVTYKINKPQSAVIYNNIKHR